MSSATSMARLLFLQGCALLAAAALAASASAFAGESPARTERQREILRELDLFRPPGDDPAPESWMLSAWDAAGGLDALVRLPEGAGNAARRFKRLEELYPSEKALLAGGGEDSEGVLALLAAAEDGTCAFSPEFYPEVVSADSPQPDFQILREYLRALLRRGERAAAAAAGQAGSSGAGAEAERCFRAALVCGRHLLEAKPSSVVYVTGLIYSVRGAQALLDHLVRAGDAARAARVRGFADRLAVLMRAFMWKANTALSETGGFACLPSAIRVAREDAEAFWRKEAVLRLAALRYGAAGAEGGEAERSPSFEREADEALEWVVANDPDDGVRRMAVWAALNAAPGE